MHTLSRISLFLLLGALPHLYSLFFAVFFVAFVALPFAFFLIIARTHLPLDCSRRKRAPFARVFLFLTLYIWNSKLLRVDVTM
jgi:hypothetical protein